VREILGIRLDEDVAPLFENAKPGRILLLDGDGAAYRAAATAKTLPTVYRRFLQEVLTDKFLTQSETAEVHLTASGGFKAYRDLYPTWKPYQGNRKNKAKPALLEPLRQLLEAGTEPLPDGVEIIVHRFWEADDGLVMRGQVFGNSSVIKSDDKDLRIASTPYYETATGQIDVLQDRFGWIKDGYTESQKLKVKGHGTKFFWAQMLMGDTADNIRGLDRLDGKLIAEAGTLEFLGPICDESEAANRIIHAYAKHKQDVLAEAQVLWMRRSEDDCAYKYLCELDLDPKLRAWVDSLHEYHLKVLAHKKAGLEIADA
jgi:hypothetical protein